MQDRTLSDTGLTVSRACLGTAGFGTEIDEPTCRRLVDLALDAGITFVDTANVYGGGAAETILGKALRGRRDAVVVASKVGHGRFRDFAGPGSDPNGLSRSAIRDALDASLRRLRTDYIDVYYLHAPDRAVPIDESLEALDEAVRAGKVRQPASSNYSSWQVGEMIAIAERRGFLPARVGSCLYNLLATRIEDEYLPMAQHLGVATVAYNPLAGGFLVGDQRPGAPVPGSRFDTSHHLSGQYLKRYWHDQNFDAVAELTPAASKAGRSLLGVALAWLLHHTAIDCVILGPADEEQLRRDLRALEDGPLPPELLTVCERVRTRLRGVMPDYIR